MKIFGSFILLCASICSCYFYERSEKSKLSSASEICSFIRYIKAQIEYFSTPVVKIFSSYSERTPLIDDLSCKQFKNAQKSLGKEDYKLILDFFSSLGKGLKDEELSLCSYTIEALEKSIDKQKKDLPNKIKVFRAMVLTGQIVQDGKSAEGIDYLMEKIV